MDAQTWALWAAVIAGISSPVVMVIIARYSRGADLSDKFEDRISTIETNLAGMTVKVDTMWQFQMRRGVTEAVNSGLATRNSPLRFTEDALSRLEPIKDALVAFWAAQPRDMSDPDFLLKIEENFGGDLVDRVCIPCRLSHAACLLMAFAVAKQQNPIDFEI